jgi:hypothetical protein
MGWAVFDLSCTSPTGMRLVTQRLNAGDLSLSFADHRDRRVVTIRQIALAGMALKRKSIESWLIDQEQLKRNHFRPVGQFAPVRVSSNQGRELKGVTRRLIRRRRFFFLRRLPPELLTAVLHDEARDRLVIVQASDGEQLAKAARSVGWAA